MRLSERLNVTFVLALLTMIFAASPAAAQCGFADWDEDENTYLDDNEFDTALEEIGYYDDWDADGDGALSEDEWYMGVDSFGVYTDEDYGEFSEWDENGDGELTKDEFDNGLFDTVDRDNNEEIDETDWDLFDEEEDGLFC